jgi:hypothetical protein
MISLMPTVLRSAALLVRWWFGATYLVAGLGCVIASPVVLARGDYGGIYMIIGGFALAALAYLIHPWGWKRPRRVFGKSA